MGKTVVAAMVIAEILRRKGDKILFLAPTKPLVEQHAASLREILIVERIAVFTGEVASPEDRELLWRENKIIVSTPQVIRNDLRTGRYELEDVSLIVFDEAHRAVGDYAYVDVAAAYKEVAGRLVLGMTASPGSSAEKILEVCNNLGITAVEIRTEFDADVVPYVQSLEIQRIPIDAPDEAKDIRSLLETVYEEQVERLKKIGFLQGKPKPSTKDILAAGDEIRKRLDGGDKDGRLFGAMTAQAIAMKANHAITLAETQGMGSLRSYFDRLETDAKSRADTQFIKHAKVREAIKIALETSAEHPKLKKTAWVVRDQFMAKPDSKVIVFTHYRETSDTVTRELSKIPGIKPVRFVGQSSKGEDVGLKQREQVDILEKFRNGEINVIVATSIGEEGLDIPQVDLVVFYEPVASDIRLIQRSGRTGRDAPGRVVILTTNRSLDETYLWSGIKRERRMQRMVRKLAAAGLEQAERKQSAPEPPPPPEPQPDSGGQPTE